MDCIVVGDRDCGYVAVASRMVNSPVAGLVRKTLVDLLYHLNVNHVSIYELNRNLENGSATLFISIVRGMEAWRSTNGTSSTLSKLVSALQACGLNDVADSMKSTFCLTDSLFKRFEKISKAVAQAIESLEGLTIIKATSKKLLYDWIRETADGNVVLVDDFENLSKLQHSSEKIFIVKTTNNVLEFEALEKLRKQIQNKKLVLVTEQDPLNCKALAIPVIEQYIDWKDLTEDYQQIILNKPILFGQCETTLLQIVNDIGLNILNHDDDDDEFLSNLLLGTSQLFPLSSSPVLNCYVERKLIPRNQISNNVFNDDSVDTFVFTGLTRPEFSMRLPHKKFDISTKQVQKQHLDVRFILLVLYSDFKMICKKAKPNSAVHWLHYQKDAGLKWFKSFGNMVGIQGLEESSNIRYTEENFIDFIENEQNILSTKNSVIISDSPGMGKSVLLAKLSSTLSHKYPNRIIVLLELEKFIKRNKPTTHANNLFELFVKETCAGNKLSEAIIRYICKNRGNCSKIFVEIFIDGFDEVDADDRKVAESLITTIQSKFLEGKVRIWMTTRPHLLDKLENLLNVLGYNIEPFEEYEQIRFIKSVWTDFASTDCKTLDKERLGYFSEKCLSMIKEKQSQHERDIAGIPLLCLLIAETYSQNAIEYCHLPNVADKQVTPTFNVYSITDLCRNVIKNKFQKYRKLSQGINWEGKKSMFINLHSKMSISLIFHNVFPLTTPLLNDTNIQDLFIIGIVESSSSVTAPSFIHRTFAEYFAALYIVEGICNKNDQFKPEFLLNHVFKTTGDAKLVEEADITLNLYVKIISFQQAAVCMFVDSFLAENGKDINDIPHFNNIKVDFYPYIAAAISDDCIQLFQLFTANASHYNDSNSENNVCKKRVVNLLFLAVRFSCVDIIRLVLEDFKKACTDDENVTTVKANGITLLHIAVKFREYAVVSELIDIWDDKLQEQEGLVHACITDTLDLEDALISDKVEILHLLWLNSSNIINAKFQGLAPLHIPNVHPMLESKIVALGADLKIFTDDGKTVLHKRMCSDSHFFNFLYEVCKQRNKEAKDLVRVKDNLGFTPLHEQICQRKWTIELKTLKLFRDLCTDFNSENKVGESVITSAIIFHHNEDVIQSLVYFGADINRSNADGSLYHIALSHRNFAAFNVLMNKNLDVNLQNKHGNTPLHNLFTHWDQEPNEMLAFALVEHDASLDIKNEDGFTPLECCLANRTVGNPIITVKLLKALCQKNKGLVPVMNLILQTLILSAQNHTADESLELAHELVENGADPLIITKHGSSLLFSAMEMVCLPIIKWLIENDLQVNSENMFGDTPLHHLMLFSQGNDEEEFEVFNYLMGRRALTNKLNFEHETVMDVAVKNEKRVFALVCKSVHVSKVHVCKNVVTKTFFNLAFSASYERDLDMIEALVKYGYGVNHQDHKGNTVLHYAVQRRSVEWVRYFLNIGANSQIKNNEMRLPIHMIYYWALSHYKPQPALELVKMLLPDENNEKINATDWIKLHEAVCFGDTATFKNFLGDISYHEYLFCDHFVWFVMGCQSLKIISAFSNSYTFLNGLSLINLGNNQETSLLHVVIVRNIVANVEYLLQKQGFSETLDSHRMRNLVHTLVQHSCIISNKDLDERKLILEVLLSKRNSLVNEIYEGRSPLLVDNIHVSLIILLIENGADVTAVDIHGGNIAHLAVEYLEPNEYYDLMTFLFHKDHWFLFRDKGKNNCTALHRAVNKQFNFSIFLRIVRMFKMCKANFNYVDENNQSVLVCAIKARCNPENQMILELIRNGSLWNTLLKTVSREHTIVMLKHLMLNGIDILVEDTTGDCINSLIRRYLDDNVCRDLLKNVKKSGYVKNSSKIQCNLV